MEDAIRAAAALTDNAVGARRVLLFGSVAKGTQKAGSDIDLVAVFDDIGNYEARSGIERAARRAAEAASGRLCDIMVTDRAEWAIRCELSAAAECAISKNCVVLSDLPPLCPVDYSKKIGRPSNAREEAVWGAAEAADALWQLGIQLDIHARACESEQWADTAFPTYRNSSLTESIMTSAQPALEYAFGAYVRGVLCVPYIAGDGVGRFEHTFNNLPADAAQLISSALSIGPHMADDWESTKTGTAERSGSVSDAVGMSVSAARIGLILACEVRRLYAACDASDDLASAAGTVLRNAEAPSIAELPS